MPLNLSTADAALKEDYQPAVREQLNSAFMLLSQIERNSKDVEGRRAVLSLHVRRNNGVGARAEGGTLPAAGNQGYQEERVGLRYNYGRIKLTGPVLRAMRSDAGSFVRALDSETKGVTTDLKIDVNRQLYGTSDGVIASLAVQAGAAATFTVAATTSAVQRRQLEVGMLVDIGTVANPTAVASAREIVSVSGDVYTILGANITHAATDKVFRSGNGGSGAAQKELTGLQTIVSDTGTLFNVDPAVQPVWKAKVLANGGVNRAATDTLFETLIDEVGIASGIGSGSLFVASQGVSRNYAAGLKSQKRFNDTVELKGGFRGLTVSSGDGSATLTSDKDAPANTAFLVNTEHLFQHEMSDWEWMDEDGAVLSRVSNEDAYEAVLFKYHELTTDKRNAHGVVRDLTES